MLEKGDLVIDGGNSRYTDDAVHAEQLAEKGIRFADCGVSGGIWGLKNGYGLMAGGDAADIKLAMPIFDALRPEGPRAEGFVHAGSIGAGHYAKMVHNGIEYAQMQALGEGYELLDASNEIIHDVTGVFKAWQRGTVVRSWLLELLVKALEGRPGVQGHRGLRRRLGRGPLDDHRGAQPRGPGSDDQRVDLRPVRVAAEGLAGDEGRRGPAQPVRRPRRAQSPDAPSP